MSTDPGVYLDYWKLTERPFENVPNPEVFYQSEVHAHALDLLTYALRERKAAALLTGEYGTGKTTAVRVMLGRLDRPRLAIVLINYPLIEPEILFRTILEGLDGADLPEGTDKSRLYSALGDRFIANARRGLHNLVIIDEAQALRLDSMYEELRLLLNYQLNDRNLVTLILVGQDDLWTRVSKMPQLAQRFSVKCRLREFDLEQTIVYIRHRLERCGGDTSIFSREALEAIHGGSGGVPRRINNICDLALLIGSQQRVEVIGKEIVDSIWA